MELKKCTKCGIDKENSVEYFHRQRKGLRTDCKSCVLEKKKEYDKKNKEKLNEYSIQYHKDNRERMLEYKKNYHKENKERTAERVRKWRKENRIISNKYSNEYFKDRFKNDPIFRMTCNLRARTKVALRGKNNSVSTMDLLGCSSEFLRNHIESQFTDGMSWDNYGDWHLDHIKPFASFDNLLDPVQQREVCHYTNLQPMWAFDNLSKGAKWSG